MLIHARVGKHLSHLDGGWHAKHQGEKQCITRDSASLPAGRQFLGRVTQQQSRLEFSGTAASLALTCILSLFDHRVITSQIASLKIDSLWHAGVEEMSESHKLQDTHLTLT